MPNSERRVRFHVKTCLYIVHANCTYTAVMIWEDAEGNCWQWAPQWGKPFKRMTMRLGVNYPVWQNF